MFDGVIAAIRRWMAIVILTCGYTLALAAKAISPAPRKAGRSQETGRVMVIGTFHNPNWFYAHLHPLADSGVGEIVLIGDGHIGQIQGLKVIVPNKYACKILSRAGAKFLWSLWYAFRLRPSIYMGYAIFPAAVTASILGSVFRRPACFQITSGPLELEGGGYKAENRVLAALNTPSKWIEKLAFAVTKRFDLLVVRGVDASNYVKELGYTGEPVVVTGSVEVPESCPPMSDRAIDLVFIGRLTERKRPDRFISVVERVAQQIPDVRTAIVGDGPETAAIEEQLAKTGLVDQVDLLGLRSDVLELLLRSKLFVLTSRWEGVSIAMLEAMACGSVPIVSDVGDLSDVVRNGKNGYLFDENDIPGFADTIVGLLNDPERLDELSKSARNAVITAHSRTAIADRWGEVLTPYVTPG